MNNSVFSVTDGIGVLIVCIGYLMFLIYSLARSIVGDGCDPISIAVLVAVMLAIFVLGVVLSFVVVYLIRKIYEITGGFRDEA